MSKDLLVGRLLNNATSLAASFNTSAIIVRSMDNVGFTVITSGVTANTGTVIPQIRIKQDDNFYSGWIDLTLDVPVILANADISQFINLNQLPPCEVRLKYTKSGGTTDGTVIIYASGTEI